MIIRGHIIDSKTKAGIPRVSVTIVNTEGKYLGQGVYTDDNGDFGLDSDVIDGNLVLVTDVAYSPIMVDPNALTVSPPAVLELGEDIESLDPAVITAKRRSRDAGIIFFLVVAGGTIYGMSRPIPGQRTAKSKAMAGIGQVSGGGFDFSKVIIPLAIVGLGAAVLVPLLQKLGLLSNQEDAARAAAASAAAAQQSTAGKTATSNRNYTDAELKSFITQITDATDGTFYAYSSLIDLMSYWAHFRSGDAKRFLGLFVDIDGQTVYKWWVDKFFNATNLNAGGIFSEMNSSSNKADYQTMGLGNINPFATSPDDIVLMVVKYLYSVAGTAVQ